MTLETAVAIALTSSQLAVMQRMKGTNSSPLEQDNYHSSSSSDSTEAQIITDSSDMATKKPMSISIDIGSKENKHDLEFTILCINLRTLPGFVQFLACCAGVFFFYLIYGYLQELIFRVDGFKPFGWYLTLVQFAFYSFFGLVELHVSKDSKRKVPLKTYLLIAFLTVATMGLSNSSLGYLNYPTQVIFKCCKLIPVLIGGVLIQGKKFSSIDVVACLCMSVGISLFTLADSSISPSFSLYGVLLIMLALCADAVIGNVQEKVMKQFNCSNSEMVLFSYSIGFVYILAGQVATQQLWTAFSFCYAHPVMYLYAFLFSISGYLGVNIVLNLVKIYGALIAVTVTTCRKAVTIVLSFLLFTKPFTMQYVWSGVIVVVGIYLNVYSKNKVQWDAKFTEYWQSVWRQRQRLVTMQNLEHVV